MENIYEVSDAIMANFNAQLESAVTKAPREIVWNKERTIDDLYADTVAIQRRCFDYADVDLNTAKFSAGNNCPTLTFTDNGETVVKSFTQHSLTQFCNIVGVPVSYVQKMLAQGEWGKALAETNLSTWIDKAGFSNNYLVRSYGETIRGILSSRFTAYDAPEIADALRRNLDPYEFKAVGSVINPERFHARIINRHAIEVAGDELCWGLYVDSSDVGRGAINITLFLWRQVCSNGLVVPMGKKEMFYTIHRGNIEEFAEGIRAAVASATPVVEKTLALVNTASNVSVDTADNFNKMMNLVKSNTGLSTKETEDLLRWHMVNAYPDTLWGLVNSITERAQKYSLEKRLDIEKGAGKILLASA